jgi:hypothetical protein
MPKQPKERQSPANDDSRTSDDREPVAVREDSEKISESSKEENHRNAERRHWAFEKVFGGIALFLTFIAAAGAIAAAAFTGWQAWIAQDTEKRQLRAYVIVKSAEFARDNSGNLKFGREFPGGKELLIYYTVSNEGVTPAYDVFRQITVEYPFANTLNFNVTDGTAAYISKEHTFGPIITRAYTPDEINDISKGGEGGAKLLVFAGRITYKDIFERPWPTFFCFAYLSSPEPKFTFCPRWNDRDILNYAK